MKMKKERIFDYAGDLKMEVEEIKRMMTETKEQDSLTCKITTSGRPAMATNVVK